MRHPVVKLQTWACASIVGIAAFCGEVRPASAHPELVANQVNRYLTVAVTDSRIEISVALLFGELPAGVERKRLDTNQDGTISDEERVAGEAYWAARAEELASFVGKTSNLGPWQAVLDLGDDRRSGPIPLVADLRREGVLTVAPTRVAVGPHNDLAAMGETEIGLVLGPGWKLAKSTAPDGKTGLDRVFKLPAEVRRNQPSLAAFDLEPESSAPNESQKQTSHPSQGRLWLVGGAIAVAGLVLAALGWRRKPRG